jgi:hypothetical protein
MGWGPASNPSNPVTPSPFAPSSDATPKDIRLWLNGVLYQAIQQMTEGEYLFVLPDGTDISALPVSFVLPDGATISPPSGTLRDFQNGPAAYTITAQDGTTTKDITVNVKLAAPAPTPRTYFSTNPADCEIFYDTNENGSLTAYLRVAFAEGAEPALIDAMRATITLAGASVSGSSYSYASAAASPTAAAYLQVLFVAPTLAALRGGELEKIDYWLSGDETHYAQTYTPPLSFADILDGTPPPNDGGDDDDDDQNPPPPNDGGDNPKRSGGGGGCDAGSVGLLGIAFAAAGLFLKKQR